ncbi:MAG: DNA recombination protein RmuC [Parachlamydiales bacterium]|jgi:DNA recombination protein RmuC
MSTLFLVFIFSVILMAIWQNYSLNKSKKALNEAFKSMSFDIMRQNNESFIELARSNFDKYHEGFKADIEFKKRELENVLNPVKESIEKINSYTKEVEKQRLGDFSSLNKQLDILIESESSLRRETANLTKALSSPNMRGSWGQIHLRRVVELCGMLNNCDFYEQKTAIAEDKSYRPDLVVKLPGDKLIIIDAKTPIDAFLESQDQVEEKRTERFKAQAQNLKKHVIDLASKEYFTKFNHTPEYVILFLPTESILSAAIQVDPAILEVAAAKNIIIATPTTLIAILKTVAYIWKEDAISKSADEIARVGKELYERLMTMNSHFIKLGRNLSTSVEAYNQTVASLNSRVMVSAKKLKDMGLSHKENELEELSTACYIKSEEV